VSSRNFAQEARVIEHAFEQTIVKALAESDQERAARGRHARQIFEQRDRAFAARLRDLVSGRLETAVSPRIAERDGAYGFPSRRL
jgi:hypothetical protein